MAWKNSHAAKSTSALGGGGAPGKVASSAAPYSFASPASSSCGSDEKRRERAEGKKVSALGWDMVALISVRLSEMRCESEGKVAAYHGREVGGGFKLLLQGRPQALELRSELLHFRVHGGSQVSEFLASQTQKKKKKEVSVPKYSWRTILPVPRPAPVRFALTFLYVLTWLSSFVLQSCKSCVKGE